MAISPRMLSLIQRIDAAEEQHFARLRERGKLEAAARERAKILKMTNPKKKQPLENPTSRDQEVEEGMIDGFDAYLREPRVEQIFDATARDARTPRSVEAHGRQERDEDGHPPGTRVVIQFGSNVGVTSSSSDTSIHTVTFYAAMPVTEVGPYVSNKIVEDMKATLHFDQTRVPPTVRGGRR